MKLFKDTDGQVVVVTDSEVITRGELVADIEQTQERLNNLQAALSDFDSLTVGSVAADPDPTPEVLATPEQPAAAESNVPAEQAAPAEPAPADQPAVVPPAEAEPAQPTTPLQ